MALLEFKRKITKAAQFPFVWLLSVGLFTLACRGSATPASLGLSSGDHSLTLDVQGIPRTYLIHVPPQAVNGRPVPVVLNFHGGGGNAQGHQAYVQMDALADEAGFLVVYPNGTGPFESRLLTWNAGTCCGYARDNQIDDVEFVRLLLDDLGRQIPIDGERVYATGLSNGAMMAYRLAAQAPDRISAIAPVAGAMVAGDVFAPTQPVPILHIHSVDDPRALYDGGLGPPFPFTNARVFHNPVEEVIGAWVALNGCASQPVVEDTLAGELGTQNEGHTATRISYGDCTEGANVVLWKMTVAGHVWPGGTPDYLTRVLGPSTDLIDANREMWAFFSQLP